MIGQTKLISQIQNMIDNDTFPRFSIIVGQKGSGRKSLTKVIHSILEGYIYYILPDIKIDTIRTMIEDAITTQDKMLIVIPDADTMSVNAKNALLKIVEEPPKNVHIIMALENIDNTLETIKSRAFVFNMQIYSKKELESYFEERAESDLEKSNEKDLLLEIAEVPNDVDLLLSYGKDFIDYVEFVVENIAEVEPANAFKSSVKLAIKNEDGYDLKLFWHTFMHICLQRYNESHEERFLIAVKDTSRYVKMLQKLGVNKQQLYDLWVFDVRDTLWT